MEREKMTKITRETVHTPEYLHLYIQIAKDMQTIKLACIKIYQKILQIIVTFQRSIASDHSMVNFS